MTSDQFSVFDLLVTKCNFRNFSIIIALRARLFTDFSQTPNVPKASKFSCNDTLGAKRYNW